MIDIAAHLVSVHEKFDPGFRIQGHVKYKGYWDVIILWIANVDLGTVEPDARGRETLYG